MSVSSVAASHEEPLLSRLRVLVFRVAPLMLAGCVRVPEAVDRFERQFICPRGRLAVGERKDLKAHHFACAEQRAPEASPPSTFWRYHAKGMAVECGEPPPGILADPERLRFWQERRERGFEALDREVGAIVEVEGCGVRRFYAGASDLGGAEPSLRP